MNFYEVSWSWYEEYAHKTFYSQKKLSKEEFEVLIKKLSKEAAESLVDKHDGWIGNANIIKLVWELLKKEGFYELEYGTSYGMWGSGIINSDDEGYLEHFDQETFDKICQHNQKFGKKLYEKLDVKLNV